MKAAEARTRVSFKNILFATDLSYLSEAAIPYVLETARLYGSKVHALHVRTPLENWTRPQEDAVASLKKQLKDVPHEVSVEDGSVREVLLRQILEKGIDLVVLCTHGRTGLGRVLLGSVAEAIFRECPCPVLTVGPRLAGTPPWTLKIKSILYATDLTPSSAEACRFALSLAQENQARLTILNVQTPPKVGELVESERYVSSTLRRLQELVPDEERLWCEPAFSVEQGEPAEKILDVAARIGADLIVMGIRPHAIGTVTHVFRPTAHRVVAGAMCPVLTARSGKGNS
jgi:nucleotide-binding universal stress UspA family protein